MNSLTNAAGKAASQEEGKMSKPYSIALLAGLSCFLVFANGARAGVTIDVVFQDGIFPTGITINAGDAGPGCTFRGYYGNAVSTGYCMDVIMKSTKSRMAATSPTSCSGVQKTCASSWVNPRTRNMPWRVPDRS